MTTDQTDLPWQRAIVLLTGTAIGIIVIAALYWVQVIFIPLALATLLTFLLGPPVRYLQKRRLGRTASIFIVVTMAALFLAGLGWVLTAQLTSLVKQLPDYQANINNKIHALKRIFAGTGRFQEMYEQISSAVQPSESTAGNGNGPPVKVVVDQWGSPWVGKLLGYAGTAAGALGGFAFVMTLTVFMLFNREDLRSRFLRLTGRDRLTVTTKALDEAFRKISRYLLTQLLLNTVVGIVLAIGLYMIGFQHVVLWGIMAAVMRYVPYIGIWCVALLLAVLSVAMFDGWLQPFLAIGLILAVEITAGNMVEPWLYGRSIGVSQVALLVAAAFWAFLWGPIGLVLSGPMTVCLVVLGRYVPPLKFIDVLLSDEPALPPDVSYYQRLLASDKAEAIELALAQGEKKSPQQVYDSVLIPALTYAKRDLARDQLTEEDEIFVNRVTSEIIEGLGKRKPADDPPPPSDNLGPKPQIIACPGMDDTDALALAMLRQVVGTDRWDIDTLSPEMLTSEMVSHVKEKKPEIVCIGSLPPGGLGHARYLCKRLRSEFPDLKIVVGRWGLLQDALERNKEELKEAGRDEVQTSLAETRDRLNYWLSTHELRAA